MFYGFGQMYNDVSTPVLSYQESIFTARKTCVPPVLLCPSYSLTSIHLHTLSILLCFLKHHSVGIIQEVALSNGLLSHSTMYLRLLSVFAWLNSLFLPSIEHYSNTWMCQFIFPCIYCKTPCGSKNTFLHFNLLSCYSLETGLTHLIERPTRALHSILTSWSFTLSPQSLPIY